MEECAYTLGEHRHEPIMPNGLARSKPFLLLCCRDFLLRSENKTKPNGRFSTLSFLAHNQDRDFGVGEDFAGLAAEQDCGEALAAVGGHEDQVAIVGVGGA